MTWFIFLSGTGIGCAETGRCLYIHSGLWYVRDDNSGPHCTTEAYALALLAALGHRWDGDSIVPLAAAPVADKELQYLPFNLNHHIKFKLTEAGRAALRAEHERIFTSEAERKRYPYRAPVEDADGWCEMQAHQFIASMGRADWTASFDGPVHQSVLVECTAPAQPTPGTLTLAPVDLSQPAAHERYLAWDGDSWIIFPMLIGESWKECSMNERIKIACPLPERPQ